MRKAKQYVCTVLALMMFTSGAAISQTATGLDRLKAGIEKLKKDESLSTAAWGVMVMEATTGKEIASYNPHQSLMTASTMKTITSGAALSILGPDFRFETKIETDGKVDGAGVLNGNIFIRGGGDPTLGFERIQGNATLPELMQEWTAAIRATGIKSITGSVIADGSIFEEAMAPSTWPWSDLGNYYGAGACGLSIHENLYFLTFKYGPNIGDTTTITKCEPEIPGMVFHNRVTVGPSSIGDQAFLYGTEYAYLRHIRGTLPQGITEYAIKGAIPDPELFAAQSLTIALRSAGTTISGNPSTMRILKNEGQISSYRKTRILLQVHKSPPLNDIVYWLNKKSVNLYAEHLVKYLGYRKYGQGTNFHGTLAITEYWKSKGISTLGFRMADGSGLSRNNGITPAQMAEILSVMSKDSSYAEYLLSLPVAGVADDPGGWGNFGKGTPAASNLRAKSGFIAGVRGYAGYFKSKSGKLCCFSMLANNHTCGVSDMRIKFQDLMLLMVELE